jgi:hypothetical protein
MGVPFLWRSGRAIARAASDRTTLKKNYCFPNASLIEFPGSDRDPKHYQVIDLIGIL